MSNSDTTTISYTQELDKDYAAAVLGPADAHMVALEDLIGVDIFVRGTTATITGAVPAVTRCAKILKELESLARRGHDVSAASLKFTVGLIDEDEAVESVRDTVKHDILAKRGKVIRPKTAGQRDYVAAIDTNTVIFGVGPAGSGKTYLAVAKAVQALNNKEVSRIILTRPAVEAGEKLGFLPGTLTEKIDPYLRPLYDALRDMLDPEIIPKLMESGVIEVAPLAYMRGRTLSDSFVILDEAQNTTAAQMKMFLTRLGFGSKMVITGDITQVDLPGGQRSGLTVARTILKDVDGVHVAELSSDDVVRHHVVAAIVNAYAEFEENAATRTRP